MKKIKVDLGDPLTLVRHTIRQIQRFGNKPDIEAIEKFREQIDKSISDEAGNNEVLDVIRALDTYMDNGKHQQKTLVSLRKLQWEIEESKKAENPNDKSRLAKEDFKKESDRKPVTKKIEKSFNDEYDIDLD